MTEIAAVPDETRSRALKPRDAWWTVLVVDPLAVRVLPRLVNVPAVTPLRLTALAAIFGAGSVACFLSGQLVLAAVLFEVRFFADCLDGKLARLRRTTSPRGAFADLTADVVLVSAALAALGWYLVHDRAVPPELPGAALFAAMVLFWLILYDLDHPAEVRARQRPRAGVDRWLADRRLERTPRTIEVETGVLFLAPLTGSTAVLVAAFAAALAYYVVAGIHLAIVLFRRQADAAPAGTEPGP